MSSYRASVGAGGVEINAFERKYLDSCWARFLVGYGITI